MKQIHLKAKSSSGGSYDVAFSNENGILAVSCSCKAGAYHKLCKHKTGLLNGDEAMLDNPNEVAALREIREWLSQSSYAGLLAEYESVKKQTEEMKKKETRLRGRVERVLTEGIPIGENGR